MKIDLENISIEGLTERIINGFNFCNTTWQKSRDLTDNPEEWQKLSDLLNTSVKRLHALIYAAWLLDYDECVFGECKFSNDFHCFGCSKQNHLEVRHG